MTRSVLLLLVLFSCAPRAAEVRVFAAASLAEALTEIAAGYAGDEIVFNFAASSLLARQINEGAPADLFLSADETTMNRVLVSERVSVLSNRLVIVGATPADLAGKSIALADPAHVPAGIYARQYLHSAGLWDVVAPRVVPTENVRAALAAFVAGNVDAAIVYKTDARGRQAFEIGNGPRISYPFAILRNPPNREGARRFYAYLRSKEALDIFRKHGFVVL